MAQHQQIPEALTPFLRPVDELATLPGNPRVGDIDAVAASLEAFGQRYPIVVRDGTVIAGNHRLEAARRLGWTHIAVVDADDLTEEQARAFAAADNRTSDLASYDDALLGEFLKGIEDLDLLTAAGYSHLDVIELTTNQLPTVGGPPRDGEWAEMGMPDYEQQGVERYKTLTVHFPTKENYESFLAAAGYPPNWVARYAWYPRQEFERYSDYAYIATDTDDEADE